MQTLEELKTQITAACPEAEIDIVENPTVPAQRSLRVGIRHAREVARFLKSQPGLEYDFCSNVTGVDWLDRKVKAKIRKIEAGMEREVEETQLVPGYLEVIYHLYSIKLRHGPLVIRVRTSDRAPNTTVPSLTPVWRSCEFQEREVYDLFGVRFEGHPDLRRILMWDGFMDHPMRKDYMEPDDYEYEPTPHDRVLERASLHRRHGEADSNPSG